MMARQLTFLVLALMILVVGKSQQNADTLIRIQLLDSITGQLVKDGRATKAGLLLAKADTAGAIMVPAKADTIEVSAAFYKPKRVVLASQRTAQRSVIVWMVPARMDTATVVARRRLVFFDNEKVWLDVKADSSLRGRPLLEAFVKMPFTVVYNQQVKLLDNRQTFLMLVDGKRSALLASSPSAALQFIAADSIDRIEMLDPAPLRFRQQGWTVVFNIITKNGLARGYSLQASASAGTLGNTASANASRLTKSSDAALQVSTSHNWQDERGTQALETPQVAQVAVQQRFNRSFQQTISGEYGYKSKQAGDFFINARWMRAPDNTYRQTATTIKLPVAEALNNVQAYRQRIGQLSAGIGWAKVVGKTDVSASYQLQWIDDDRGNDWRLTDAANDPLRFQLAVGNGRYQLHQAQLNAAMPLGKKHQLEASLQMAARRFAYAGTGQVQEGGFGAPLLPDSNALYQQHIKQWLLLPTVQHAVSLGKLRLTTTLAADFFWQNTQGLAMPGRQQLFVNWTPAIRASRPAGKRGMILASFSRSVRRNSYFSLNPFTQVQSNFLQATGNLSLPFQINNSAYVQWRRFGQKGSSLSLQLYHSWTQQAILRILSVADTGSASFAYAASASRSLALYAQASFSLAKNLQFSFGSALGVYTVRPADAIANRQLFYYIQPNIYYRFPKANMTVGAMAYLNSVIVNDNSIARGNHMNEFYLNKQLGRSKWMGGFSITDPFNLNSRQFERTVIPDFRYRFDGTRSTRAVSLSITYMLQKNGTARRARRTSTGSGDILPSK